MCCRTYSPRGGRSWKPEQSAPLSLRSVEPLELIDTIWAYLVLPDVGVSSGDSLVHLRLPPSVDQQRADRMTDSTPHALAPWAPGTAGIRTAHRGPVRGGDVVGSSQIVLAGTIPQENPVFVRASAKLRESHSTKGRTHEAEDLLRAIGQSETEIRCS
jgi:hypothetical protein